MRYFLYTTIRFLPALFFILFFKSTAVGQEIEIFLGPDKIGENEDWTITFRIKEGELKNDFDFPIIEGFQKKNISTSTHVFNVNGGAMQSAYSVTQTYKAIGQGTFIVQSFKMKVNDQVITSQGKKVIVGPPVEIQPKDFFDSFGSRKKLIYDSISVKNFTKWELVDLPGDPLRAAIDVNFFVEEQPSVRYSDHTDKRNDLNTILSKVPMTEGRNYCDSQLEGKEVYIDNVKYISFTIYRMYFNKSQENISLPEFTFYLQANRSPINEPVRDPAVDKKRTEVQFTFKSQKFKKLRK